MINSFRLDRIIGVRVVLSLLAEIKCTTGSVHFIVYSMEFQKFPIDEREATWTGTVSVILLRSSKITLSS